MACLRDAGTGVLAFYGFPVEHRRQIWSTNSLARLNREVGRRCEVVGIFPNRAALLRLAGAVLKEQNDEWAVGRRYFSTESMNKLYQPSNEEVVKALLDRSPLNLVTQPHDWIYTSSRDMTLVGRCS